MSNTISNVALKLRLYPNQEQKSYFNKSFGCERFVYNYYLSARNIFYEKEIVPLRREFDYYNLLEKFNKLKENKKKTPKEKQEQKELKNLLDKIKKITDSKYKELKLPTIAELKNQKTFLKEADSQGLCNAYMNLCTAFQKFYKGEAGAPNFHSKKKKNSYKNSMMKQDCVNWNEHTIEIPKIGKVQFRNAKAPNWYKNKIKICSLTVSKTPQERYYVSILFEVRVKSQEKKFDDENQAIGLDFDCDDMYIDSNGKSALKDFGFLKQKQLHLVKLSHLQRQFARKVKSSKNREKARIKLARFEEHIVNCRRDWIEKESKRLTDKYQLIGIENLSIQGMMKGSKNAKNYEDISWSIFVSKLEQKSQFKNCRVIKVNKFFASSQICNCCGFKNPDVQKFHLQHWKCPSCDSEHQRDENAALNIRDEAIRVLREPEESEEKGLETNPSKDTHSVLPNNNLANLALEAISS